MKRRIICAALILTLLLSLLPAHILADDTQDITGKIGESITWSFDPIEGELTIDGEGAMPDWSYSEAAPWYTYRSRIFRVVHGSYGSVCVDRKIGRNGFHSLHESCDVKLLVAERINCFFEH